MIITLAGHVDHGKTALVQAITGTNTDTLAEEQRRGLTIDLGFAYTNLDGERVGFVDVPGHHRFIHNMIAGVASMQFALLVVAADDGPMPQTQEHLQILELIGLQQGAVVLNKTDKVSSARLGRAKTEVSALLSGSFLRGARVFETSAITGFGVSRLKVHLATAAATCRNITEPREFRMPVDRCFALPGIGTIVTGTVTEGLVSVGDQVVINTRSKRCRVRSLNVQNRFADTATAGDRCSLNLGGVSSKEVTRGDWVTTSEADFSASVASVRINVLLDFPRAVSHWAPVHIYHFAAHCEARVLLPPNTKLTPGSTEYAEIQCSREMQFKIGDRLIVRDADLRSTLGGATVLAVSSHRTGSRDSNWVNDQRQLDEAVTNGDIARALEVSCQSMPVNSDQVRRCWNIPKRQFERIIEQGEVLKVNGELLHEPFVESTSRQLNGILREFHKENPMATGVSLVDLASMVKRNSDVVELVVSLSLNRDFKCVGGMYSLFDHQPPNLEFNEKLYKEIKQLVDLDQPQSSGDIAKKLGTSYRIIEDELAVLCRAGKFVRIAHNRYFTPHRLRALIGLTMELTQNGQFTVREFRDASGLGRNWVIDLLEYLDRNQFTRRSGNHRVATGKPSQDR